MIASSSSSEKPSSGVLSKYRLKSKSKVISPSECLRPKFQSKYILRPKLSRTYWLKPVEFSWNTLLYFLTFAQRKSKSKSKVKLNFGPDLAGFAERIAERKLKSKGKVTQCLTSGMNGHTSFIEIGAKTFGVQVWCSCSVLTLWCPLLPYSYSYTVSCVRPD